MKEIHHQRSNLPAEAPLMVLPGCTLFPRAMLPLNIFEPRYRAMLSHALESDRMFCVATMREGVSEAMSVEDFHHIAGIGLVRACVENADGTSGLILQGLARVRFVDFVQDTPFRIARIRELHSTKDPDEDLDSLVSRILERTREIHEMNPDSDPAINEHLESLRDPEAVADLIAHSMVGDAMQRQELLEELNVRARLEWLLRHLESA